MKSVIRVKMNGKTYLTTKEHCKELGRADEYPVSEDVYMAVCAYDRFGKVYEEKSEKRLSQKSALLLQKALTVILECDISELRYKDVHDSLSILLYTVEALETKE